MELMSLIAEWQEVKELSLSELTHTSGTKLVATLGRIQTGLSDILRTNSATVLANEIRQALMDVTVKRGEVVSYLQTLPPHTRAVDDATTTSTELDIDKMMKNLQLQCEMTGGQSKMEAFNLNPSIASTFMDHARQLVMDLDHVHNVLSTTKQYYLRKEKQTSLIRALQRALHAVTNQMSFLRRQASSMVTHHDAVKATTQRRRLITTANALETVLGHYKKHLLFLLELDTSVDTKTRTKTTTTTLKEDKKQETIKDGAYFRRRYRVVRVVRDTLFGKLKLGFDREDSDRKVAIKFSDKKLVANHTTTQGSVVLESVLGEMQVLRELNTNGGHENVLRLLDECEDDHNYYTVLEFCDEGELFDIVSSGGPLSNKICSEYIGQVAASLQFMHQRGYCHLDVSLENILVDSKRTMKLCDFGLTRPVQPLFEGISKNKPGKLQYMSPELFAGQPFSGTKADVWSLGIVLFIALTGIPPVKMPADSDARFRLIINGRLRHLLKAWKLIEVLDEQAVDLMEKMLCKEGKRLTMRQVLSHAWIGRQEDG